MAGSKIISYIMKCVQSIISFTKGQRVNHLCTMNENKSSWVDIPVDILALIIYKLPMDDRVRLRCACKSWRLSKDRMIRSCADKYPCVITQISHRVWVHASKHGWLLLRRDTFPYLYNPFTRDRISLPELPKDCVEVTFTTKPTSPDCEVLALGVSGKVVRNIPRILFIIRYVVCSRRKRTWSSAQYLDLISNGDKLINLHYMKGKLFCLFTRGVMKTYNLADHSWELITSGFLEPHLTCRWLIDCFWLIEHKENLIMLHRDLEYGAFGLSTKWTIFKIDWSKMCWTVEENLTGIAFFISGRILLSAPLIDDNWNIIEDECRVNFRDERKRYSLKKEKGKEIQSSWIMKSVKPIIGKETYMEPPEYW